MTRLQSKQESDDNQIIEHKFLVSLIYSQGSSLSVSPPLRQHNVILLMSHGTPYTIPLVSHDSQSIVIIASSRDLKDTASFRERITLFQ